MNRNSDLYKTAVKIVGRIQDAGFTTLFAGGAVRDMIREDSDLNDIDIATVAHPAEISKIFRNVHGVGESFGVMMVVENGIPFEVATFREEGEYVDGRHPESVKYSTPDQDAKRRDFTINGMFYDPLTDTVYDYVGGQEDLKRGVIRTIGNAHDRFSEDYLRMLRAIRFAVRFDFKIEQSTWNALCQLSSKITGISAERIFVELNKMLIGPRPSTAIRLMRDCGLLEQILPEVSAMSGVEQPKEYHDSDVFDHTMKVVDGIGENPSEALAWSALLHDIGKPPTQTFEDRIRFNNHHHVGAEMAEKLLNRLKVSNALKDVILACVENHMHFIAVQDMRKSKLKRFLARETIETELKLHVADCLASHGGIDNYTFLRAKQEEFASEGVKPNPLLQGRDLIASGLKPGPLFGEILTASYDAQLEGDIVDRDSALLWLESYLKK